MRPAAKIGPATADYGWRLEHGARWDPAFADGYGQQIRPRSEPPDHAVAPVNASNHRDPDASGAGLPTVWLILVPRSALCAWVIGPNEAPRGGFAVRFASAAPRDIAAQPLTACRGESACSAGPFSSCIRPFFSSSVAFQLPAARSCERAAGNSATPAVRKAFRIPRQLRRPARKVPAGKPRRS